MQSKDISIIIETLEEHINQVISLNNSNRSQIQEIEDWIDQRERALATCVKGFKKYLNEYENTHPQNKQWHKTLKFAEDYLKDYEEEGLK
jgi:uncharacterized protein YaaN involved in tellurite resistance